MADTKHWSADNSDARVKLIIEIEDLVGGRLDPDEYQRSDAYLSARLDSLKEFAARREKDRRAALVRQDIHQAVRIDASVTTSDLVAARMAVAAAGLDARNATAAGYYPTQLAIEQIAKQRAWDRAAKRAVSEAMELRRDSADTQPTELDRHHARRELQHRIPLSAEGRADAFAAAALERDIEARARALAAERVAAEARAAVMAALPPRPQAPRLPMQPLTNARLADEIRSANAAGTGWLPPPLAPSPRRGDR